MDISISLVDLNARLASEWRDAFAGEPGVAVVHGSMLLQRADAWVTPTNARGSMDGGFDAAVKRYFGDGIEQRVRREIRARFGGATPVGCATCVSTAGLSAPATGPLPRYLISAPTMSGSSERVSGTLNTALAFAAAIQAARVQNATEPGGIRTVAVPGLGASTGRVPPETCARQMLAAYELMRDHAFEDFADMRAALLATLAPLAARARGRRVRVVGAGASGTAVAFATAAAPRARRHRILGIF
jgi:O-acetyl-ADP-ribose deacetylase (regulator of RNase III)